MKIPNHLIQRWLDYKSRHIITLYHTTTKSAASSIMKNGFDISLSKMRAFGVGANFANHPKHLTHYDQPVIITCLVRYNKKIRNPPFEFKTPAEKQLYVSKHGHSKPTYMKTPPGYDMMHYGHIYIVPNSAQILPLHVQINK